jgi:hypothetical protein
VAIAAAGKSLHQLHSTGAIWRSAGEACVGDTCAGRVKLDATEGRGHRGGRQPAVPAARPRRGVALDRRALKWRLVPWQELDANPATTLLAAEARAWSSCTRRARSARRSALVQRRLLQGLAASRQQRQDGERGRRRLSRTDRRPRR